jgi:Kef-type K+ transport system membrane component KefB
MVQSADLLIGLAMILLAARAAGGVATALRMPSVLGILLVGVVLGPSVTHLVPMSPALEGLSQIGVVLLMFVAGLETDLVEMRRVGAAAMLAAVGGVAVPMVGAWALARQFGFGNAEAVFIGTIMTATSVTVSAHVLRELGYLRTRVGSAILGAAIIDDVIGVMVLTVVVSVQGGGSMLDLARLTAFVPISLAVGYVVTNAVADRLRRTESNEHRFIEVLALMLAFAWAAEAIGGLAAISGAYLAGVLFSRTLLRDDLASFGNLIGYALFAPVFFVTTGMMADVGSLRAAPAFTALLFVIAVLGKVVGCYVGAFTGMVSRGEVAIVIAVLGRNSNVISDTVFTASIVVTLLTTLTAPLLLRFTLPGVSSATDAAGIAPQRMALVHQLEQLQG